MKEKYLPIGTIVTLKGATKRIMIIGYCPITEENKVYDYAACPFPEGVISSNESLVFNHNQIGIINNISIEDEEYNNFNNQIKSSVQTLKEINNITFPQN